MLNMYAGILAQMGDNTLRAEIQSWNSQPCRFLAMRLRASNFVRMCCTVPGNSASGILQQPTLYTADTLWQM